MFEGFLIPEDVYRIGSGGKQYPLCNRKKKPAASLSHSLTRSLFSICPSFFLWLSVFSFCFCLTFIHKGMHILIYCQAMTTVMPYVLWSAEYCPPAWNKGLNKCHRVLLLIQAKANIFLNIFGAACEHRREKEPQYESLQDAFQMRWSWASLLAGQLRQFHSWLASGLSSIFYIFLQRDTGL